MRATDYRVKWINGSCSFWAVIQNYINEERYRECIELLLKLENDNIVPRAMYQHVYRILYAMAFYHNATTITTWFKNNRNTYANYGLHFTTERYRKYLTDDDEYREVAVNRYIVKIAQQRDNDIRLVKGYIDNNNVNAFSAILGTMNITDTIACYMAGLSNKHDIIDVALQHNSLFTSIGLAEIGSIRVINTRHEEIYKRLLLYNHEEIFKQFNLGIRDADIYGSINLIKDDITPSYEARTIESYVLYNKRFNKEQYSTMESDFKLIRRELPTNLIETMMKMTEENRYKVYDFTMDIALFIFPFNSKETKIAEHISHLHDDVTRYSVGSVILDLEKLGVSKNTLNTLLPNNKKLYEYNHPPFEWPHIDIDILIIISLAVLFNIIIVILYYRKELWGKIKYYLQKRTVVNG